MAFCKKDIICVKDLSVEPINRDGKQLSHSHDLQEQTLNDAKKNAEREAVIQALTQAKGNKLKAAKLLNISRTTLYTKLEEFNLKH